MDKQLLQAWVEDYEACKRGEDFRRLSGPCQLADESVGMLQIHGADDASCAATFSHASLGVALVCTGAEEQVIRVANERRNRVFFAAEPVFRGARVRLFGHDRAFQPVRGRVVVGALEDEGATILLGFAGGQWALAWCEPGWSSWVIVSDDLGHVDLDAWRKMQPRARRREAPPTPPPPPPDEAQLELERLRRRVLRREHVDVVAEQAEVVVACLDNLVEQAPEERDQQLVDALCDLIVEASQKGLRANPVGRKSHIARIFSRYVGRPISAIFIGQALAAARRLAWPFVSLSSKRAGVKGRTWALDLVAASDAKDPMHRRLLARAAVGFDLTGAHRRRGAATLSQHERADPTAHEGVGPRSRGRAVNLTIVGPAEPPRDAPRADPVAADAPSSGEARRPGEPQSSNTAAEQLAWLRADVARLEAVEKALRDELDDERRQRAAALAERDQLAAELAARKAAEERILARLARLEGASRRLEAFERRLAGESAEPSDSLDEAGPATAGKPPDDEGNAKPAKSELTPGEGGVDARAGEGSGDARPVDPSTPAVAAHDNKPVEALTRTWPRRHRSAADAPPRAWVLASLGPALTWQPEIFPRSRRRPRSPRDDSG